MPAQPRYSRDLILLVNFLEPAEEYNSPIKNDTSCAHCGNRYVVAPIGQDKIQSGDFKWNEECLIEKEVPASHEAKGIINPFSGHSDEASADRVQCSHLSHAIIHQSKQASIKGITKEQTSGTAILETTTDTDKKCRSNGTANGNELDLAVAEVALKLVRIVRGTVLNVGCGNGFLGIGRGPLMGRIRGQVLHLLHEFFGRNPRDMELTNRGENGENSSSRYK
jgi:hypothetical protein